jgi:hypothetical protein
LLLHTVSDTRTRVDQGTPIYDGGGDGGGGVMQGKKKRKNIWKRQRYKQNKLADLVLVFKQLLQANLTLIV